MSDEKQCISRIKLVNGETVDIKDQEARSQLSMLLEGTIIIDCGTVEND